jgi:hypothetical protein
MTVSAIGELSIEAIRRWFHEGREEDAWTLAYRDFAPEEEMLREALTTVGNGYIGSRGAYCGAVAYDDIHYPGTYVAGLWNTLGTEVHGRTIYNNDFVNIPNWLLIELKIGDGGFCRILSCSSVFVIARGTAHASRPADSSAWRSRTSRRSSTASPR